MAIVLKVDVDAPKPKEKKAKEGPSNIKYELRIRKSLEGNIMIFDHPNMDIVLVPAKKKIVAFPKKVIDDELYSTQNEFFEFLAKKGVIIRESVQGGNVYGSMEAIVPESENFSSMKMALMSVAKFLEKEKPEVNFDDRYEKKYFGNLTEPDAERSTELGEVPHAPEKGSLDARARAYGTHYRYFY